MKKSQKNYDFLRKRRSSGKRKQEFLITANKKPLAPPIVRNDDKLRKLICRQKLR
ncbi:MAG: hypothetical protein Q4A86_02585 [Clostridia bacterium]|nr:hypothetical protein [Clostridia bacterium]